MKLELAPIVEIPFKDEAYEIHLVPGKYLLEAYGASGGGEESVYTTARDPTSEDCLSQTDVEKFLGNTECVKHNSQPGSGGYSRGILTLKHAASLYILTGGQGTYTAGEHKGGFNGGGSACSFSKSFAGSGGGATDFRLFRNSLYTRILVAGGGGGCDDAYLSELNPRGSNDGSGGSGGLTGQALWNNGTYYGEEFETNTTNGFAFGQGQRSSSCSDGEKAGAGGGFFGGYSINNNSAGASGGSSFAFAKDIPYPTGLIESKDENGKTIEKTYYAFTNLPQYLLTEVAFATGIWKGNGKARITFLSKVPICFFTKMKYPFFSLTLFVSILLSK